MFPSGVSVGGWSVDFTTRVVFHPSVVKRTSSASAETEFQPWACAAARTSESPECTVKWTLLTLIPLGKTGAPCCVVLGFCMVRRGYALPQDCGHTTDANLKFCAFGIAN